MVVSPQFKEYKKSLEKKVNVPTVINPKNKLDDSIKISYEELQDLIALSESHRQYEEKRLDLYEIEKFLKETDRTKIPLSIALEVAEEMGLGRYMSRIIESKYISKERQMMDLEEHNVLPSLEAIMLTWENTLSKCFNDFPEENILIERLGYSFSIYKLDKKIKKIFKKQEINKKDLAFIRFDSEGSNHEIRITLYDPIILRVCGNSIKQLKKRFEKTNQFYEIQNEYSVE
ncbi:MAG: hypothetical protein PHQ66_01465 [Candidatus Nanoarchaeia archaeon]|nr:hypothetical protein [Candidatus Nanoarchaeia archaeon]MDD5357955.1 hypothetical protein [Candidatus Nanoarchaeia archaeon]MDD5588874.1 hypothetical protein [Candidatus Nanoarchaeia archaeon]